jgi:hypothetical protein
VVCLAPRVPGEIVGPRRASGVVGRPLNFTVRSHLGEIQRREEQGGSFGWLCGVRTVADSVVLRASSFGATGVRVRLLGALKSGGQVTSVAGAVPHAHSGGL